MAGVGLLNLSMRTGASGLPPSARFLAYAALGWLIGQGTRDTAQTVANSAIAVTLVVVALLGFGALLGWVLVHAGVLDPGTAYLATSPGSSLADGRCRSLRGSRCLRGRRCPHVAGRSTCGRGPVHRQARWCTLTYPWRPLAARP